MFRLRKQNVVGSGRSDVSWGCTGKGTGPGTIPGTGRGRGGIGLVKRARDANDGAWGTDDETRGVVLAALEAFLEVEERGGGFPT